MMIHLGKILVRILPWDPWLPRCSKNLARSCQDSQDASKRVNPGSHGTKFVVVAFCGPTSIIWVLSWNLARLEISAENKKQSF